MSNLENLQHHGVKGMKWGVRRNRNRPGGADGVDESKKVKDTRSNVRKKLDSMKRERDWKKVMQDADKLSTKDINAVAKRVGLENDLKRLSKSSVGKAKDKQDYLRRSDMSDAELSRKVVRLRAKENLHRSVREASREQREIGQRVLDTAKAVSLTVASKKLTGKPIEAKDVMDIFGKPSEVAKNNKNDLQKKVWEKIEGKKEKEKEKEQGVQS